MNSKALPNTWLRELGATSRGMMFLGGSFATAESLHAAAGPARSRDGVEETGGARGLLGAALAAALMVAPALGLLADDTAPNARSTERIVDLPTIAVRPTAFDAAVYRHSRRIVEIDAMVVRPSEADRAIFLANRPSPPQRLAALDTRP